MANSYTSSLTTNLNESMGIPEEEDRIIRIVAEKYKLKPDELKLLRTIRKVEQGGPGIEFGVMTPSARRYKDEPAKSFTVQAMWAAGTIKKRYKGDLKKFANTYAPVGVKNDPAGLNKNWYPNAKQYMEN